MISATGAGWELNIEGYQVNGADEVPGRQFSFSISLPEEVLSDPQEMDFGLISLRNLRDKEKEKSGRKLQGKFHKEVLGDSQERTLD